MLEKMHITDTSDRWFRVIGATDKRLG